MNTHKFIRGIVSARILAGEDTVYSFQVHDYRREHPADFWLWVHQEHPEEMAALNKAHDADDHFAARSIIWNLEEAATMQAQEILDKVNE